MKVTYEVGEKVLYTTATGRTAEYYVVRVESSGSIHIGSTRSSPGVHLRNSMARVSKLPVYSLEDHDLQQIN